MFEYNILLAENYNSKAKIVVNQGGTSSGKTYNILECLILKAIQAKSIITVVGQDIPNLKKGAIRDLQNICTAEVNKWLVPYIEGNSYSNGWNISERALKFKNGSIIEFQSYLTEQDARSGKRNYLFVNEANGISYEIYWQLFIRTLNQTFLDYNPSERFWVHDKVLPRKDCQLIISDHRINRHIPESLHREIEAIEDPEMFNVYARGKTGTVKGLVFQKYKIVESWPEGCTHWCYGMDFGYSNSFTTLIKTGLYGGELFYQQVVFEQALQNEDILRKLKEIGYVDKLIVCDSNEPKTRDWLAQKGINIWKTRKGSDNNPSVNYGLSLMKSYPINIVSDSADLIKEFQRYSYKKNMDGEYINEPVKMFDHGIDAGRYATIELVGETHVFGYG